MIKKLLSVLITGSLLISSAVMPAWAEETDVNVVTEFKTENLVVNGGFEDGLDGWVTDDTGVFEIVEDTFTNSGGTVHNVVNGTKALKATSGDATAGYVYQEIDVTTNTNYVLNFSWFHLSGTKGSVKVYGDEISESNLLVSAGNIFGGETWYSSTSTFNSAEYEKIIIKIDFSYATAGVYYCIDNITLKAAGNTQTIGFENGYPEDFNIRTSQFEVTDEKAYKGSHSMKLTSGNGYPIANVAFALNPNTHYAVMFWYYIEEGSLAYASKYAHQNTWKDYTTSPIRTQTLTAKGEWKRAIVTPSDNVTGSGNNCFVEVAFQNMAANTVVYIDNIQCKYYDESVDSITVTGNNESDGILHADVKAYNYGYDFEDPVSYQWQRSSDKLTWSDVEGADTEDYRLTRSDSQKYVRVKVNTSNRYSASVVDSYYSKAILINDIGYKHKKGVSYGVEMQNELFTIDDYGAQTDFELVNKTADELELFVFVGAYSDNGELIDYVVEEGINIVADEAEQISKAFSNTSIGSLGIIVFDNDMNVYYAEKLQDKGVDTAVNKVRFDKDTQIIKITGTNGGTAELVIVKDSEGEIIYIAALDCGDKTGYEVDVNIEADAYGKYSVFTSYCPDSVEVFYYSQEDYERVIGYFGDEMDKDMVLEAYRVLEVDSDLLAEIDEEKLAAVVNGVRTEVTGEELEEKKESAKAILKKMLILEAYNEGLSGIANSDGKIIYEDELELKETDSDKTTFYKLYSTFLNKDGLNKLNSMLSGQDFKSIDDFKTQFKKAVMLCAIGYPAVNGAGYIQEILTSDNMTAAGIEHSKYSSRTASQKKQINEGLVKKVFDDISDLEKEINKAVGSGPVVGTTGGSSSRPSSSSSNNYPMPSVNTNTVTKQNQIMTFNDITDEHWAYKYIYALKEIGIVNGVDEQRFEPDGLVTREQFVKMLCDAFKLTAAEGSNNVSYTDCVKGAWYEDYIQIATSQGIVGGTGDGLFGIGKPVTREDLCVMAVRALNDSAVYENAGFSDSSEIAEYAKSAVSALSAMKVISGFEDGSVRPKESCTRAQAAKIIYELKSIKEIRQ